MAIRGVARPRRPHEKKHTARANACMCVGCAFASFCEVTKTETGRAQRNPYAPYDNVARPSA